MSTNSVRINQYVHPFQQVLEGGQAISNFYGFTPLKTGHRVPDFVHPPGHTLLPGPLDKETPLVDFTPIQTQDLLTGDRPLVLVFRPTYNHEPIQQLEFLEGLQRDVQVMGGSLVIISNATIRDLKRQLKGHNALQILSDPHNSLAEKFGLYQSDNHIGDWLSGIDGDIPLPAFYVVAPSGEISYHYVDYNFRTYQPDNNTDLYQQGFVRQLLTRIYQNAQSVRRHDKTAYSA